AERAPGDSIRRSGGSLGPRDRSLASAGPARRGERPPRLRAGVPAVTVRAAASSLSYRRRSGHGTGIARGGAHCVGSAIASDARRQTSGVAHRPARANDHAETRPPRSRARVRTSTVASDTNGTTFGPTFVPTRVA